MIIPDVNILVYAHNESSHFYDKAKAWWEACLNAEEGVLLPHICINGFVRLMTHPKILKEPLAVEEAIEMVDVWLRSGCVSMLAPGERHYSIYRDILIKAGVGGKLTTDAYIAAMGIENQATVYSNDNDFSRFQGVRWANPLA
jgi:uncharacterized protein